MTIFSGKSYLEKHRFAPRQILTRPSKRLNMVVVIPSHCEPDLLRTLDSLENCDKPQQDVEVIVVINNSKRATEAVKEENKVSLAKAQAWKEAKPRNFEYHFLHFPDLPKKHAGVGLARKIGMDEAVDRLEQIENSEGIIVCLDADSQVVPNYLVEIERAFLRFPKGTACSIHFEHPLEGGGFPPEVYEGILRYELYLRYYIEGLRFAGYPYAFHTIGSSMVVRSKAYQAESGMNRRKAGEDFYFLHKFIPNPGFFELNSTRVIPSPRPAEKVPFGTGKAIVKWLEEGATHYPAYDPKAFIQLKAFLTEVKSWYKEEPGQFAPEIQAFLDQESFSEALISIRKHVGREDAFEKRFYQWFHPLKVLQYIHFTRDQYWPEIEVLEASQQLWTAMGEPSPKEKSHVGFLKALRQKQAKT
jgi:glycosyltransferase involved in cell wall biosynthesis